MPATNPRDVAENGDPDADGAAPRDVQGAADRAARSGVQGAPLDIAVIGSGIAGLSCAWLLSQRRRDCIRTTESLPRKPDDT